MTNTIGTSATKATGMRSLTASKGIFEINAGLMARLAVCPIPIDISIRLGLCHKIHADIATAARLVIHQDRPL